MPGSPARPASNCRRPARTRRRRRCTSHSAGLETTPISSMAGHCDGGTRPVSASASDCRLLGVQVGRAEPLLVGAREVLSGIRKSAVVGPVPVRALGLEGDEQADPSVHGGLSKAVYAYPIEHYAFWNEC